MGCRSVSNPHAVVRLHSSRQLGELPKASVKTLPGALTTSPLAVDSLFHVCPRRWLLLA